MISNTKGVQNYGYNGVHQHFIFGQIKPKTGCVRNVTGRNKVTAQMTSIRELWKREAV